jgi:hypothetical protein
MSMIPEMRRLWIHSREPMERHAAFLAPDARVFEITNVDKYTRQVFQFGRGTYLNKEDLNLKLPYPVTYFEYQHSTTKDPTKVGVLCAYGETEAVVGAAVIWKIKNRDPILTCMLRFDIDEQGDVKQVSYKIPRNMDGFLEHHGFEEGMRGIHNVMSDSMVAPLYANMLLGCKNVRVDVQSNHTGRTKEYRKHTIREEFRTINVDLINRVASGQISLGDRKKAGLSTIRGHFKTYTAEKPLLGKHVGRWWWDNFVRGDINEGVIQKEYEAAALPIESEPKLVLKPNQAKLLNKALVGVI